MTPREKSSKYQFNERLSNTLKMRIDTDQKVKIPKSEGIMLLDASSKTRRDN